MTYPVRPAAPDLDPAEPSPEHPPDAVLSAETDAMRAEATALDIPDTLEGLLAFALREVAALRIAVREARAQAQETRAELTALLAESAALRAECEAFAAAVGTDCETLGSEAARLKLRVRKLEGEL